MRLRQDAARDFAGGSTERGDRSRPRPGTDLRAGDDGPLDAAPRAHGRVPRRQAGAAPAQPRRHRAAAGELHVVHALRARVPGLVHLHRLAQGDAALRGRRAATRQRNVLDRFAIDFSLCMYCGICIEACPFDALFWSPEFEYAEFDIRDLLHEKDRLQGWMESVPPPAARPTRTPPRPGSWGWRGRRPRRRSPPTRPRLRGEGGTAERRWQSRRRRRRSRWSRARSRRQRCSRRSRRPEQSQQRRQRPNRRSRPSRRPKPPNRAAKVTPREAGADSPAARADRRRRPGRCRSPSRTAEPSSR